MRESILTEQRAFNKPTSSIPWGYQQMPMVPKGGYQGKKDGPAMAFPKRDVEKQLAEAGRVKEVKGAMAKAARDNIRMGILFASKQEITVDDAERLLKLTRAGARSALAALAEKQLIKFSGQRTRTGAQIYVKFSVPVVLPEKRCHKRVKPKGTRAEFYARQAEAGMEHNRKEVARCFGDKVTRTSAELYAALKQKPSSGIAKLARWREKGLIEQIGMVDGMKAWRKV